MNKKLVLIGGAAFVGALLVFGRGARNTKQPAKGASSYIGNQPVVALRQSSVTDALFGNTINLSNSTRTYGGST